MKNPDYLDKFMNLTEMAESYEGTLHDAAVFRIAILTSNLRATPEADLNEDKRATINAALRQQSTSLKIKSTCLYLSTTPKRISTTSDRER